MVKNPFQTFKPKRSEIGKESGDMKRRVKQWKEFGTEQEAE